MGYSWKNFSLKSKLVTTCIFITVGVCVIFSMTGLLIERIKINGPIYHDILRGKDLIADILPPPEYIIESYLVVSQAMAEKDPSKIPSYYERLKKLQVKFDERHTYWAKNLPEGKIKALLLEQSYKPAVLFYSTVTNDLFPALAAGRREQAEKLLNDVLNPTYEAHRIAVDEIVNLSNAENIETEKHASTLLRSSRVIVAVIGVTFFACVLATFIFIINNITGQLGGDPSYVAEIARKWAGSDLPIDVVGTGDGNSVLGVMQELHSSKQMLEAVTQGITESILLLSTDFKIMWANKAAMAQSGLTLNEIVGKHCYSATHHRDSPCEPPNDSCPLSDLLATGKPKTVNHIHFDKDGNKIFAEVVVYPVKDNMGEIVELVHISRDITERVRMEEEIADKVMQLEASLARVKQLEGIIPICMYCKKIRDDIEIWHQLEGYISQHSEAIFSHGICPECYKIQLIEIEVMLKQ